MESLSLADRKENLNPLNVAHNMRSMGQWYDKRVLSIVFITFCTFSQTTFIDTFNHLVTFPALFIRRGKNLLIKQSLFNKL